MIFVDNGDVKKVSKSNKRNQILSSAPFDQSSHVYQKISKIQENRNKGGLFYENFKILGANWIA